MLKGFLKPLVEYFTKQNNGALVGGDLTTQVARGANSTVIGRNNTAAAANDLVEGSGNSTVGSTGSSVVWGVNNTITQNNAGGDTDRVVCVGFDNTAVGWGTVVFGKSNVCSSGYDNVVMGRGCQSRNANTCIGRYVTAGQGNSLVVGQNSEIGWNFQYGGDLSMLVGNSCLIRGGTRKVQVGLNHTDTSVTTDGGAFGYLCTTSAANAWALGKSITNATADSLEAGPSNTAKIGVSASGQTLRTHTAYAAGVKCECTAVVSTTNNTPTLIKSISTTTAYVYWVNVRVVCRRTDSGDESGTFERRYHVKNVAGVVTVTAIGSDVTYLDTLTTADVTANANSTAFEIKVTGETSKTLVWSSTIEYQGASTTS